jgi:hypothetical protein
MNPVATEPTTPDARQWRSAFDVIATSSRQPRSRLADSRDAVPSSLELPLAGAVINLRMSGDWATASTIAREGIPLVLEREAASDLDDLKIVAVRVAEGASSAARVGYLDPETAAKVAAALDRGATLYGHAVAAPVAALGGTLEIEINRRAATARIEQREADFDASSERPLATATISITEEPPCGATPALEAASLTPRAGGRRASEAPNVSSGSASDRAPAGEGRRKARTSQAEAPHTARTRAKGVGSPERFERKGLTPRAPDQPLSDRGGNAPSPVSPAALKSGGRRVGRPDALVHRDLPDDVRAELAIGDSDADIIRLYGAGSVGFCECGCGQQTEIAKWNDTLRGHVKGRPKRFIHGHNSRGARHTDSAKAKIGAASREAWGRRRAIYMGDPARYRALHNWLRYAKKKSGRCAECGSGGKTEWANISGRYERDPEDYRELCVACHRTEDAARREAGVFRSWGPQSIAPAG